MYVSEPYLLYSLAVLLAAISMADKIASKPSSTVATGKKAFYEQAEMNLSKAYEYTSEVMRNNLLRDDAKEGISAFIDKRSPDWQDN